ncbi:hypothetical protein [Thalassotalea euphylliae]|nr:hypothetical protein [Thalassotalea euphylliae]
MMFSDEALMRQFLRSMGNIGDVEAGKLVFEKNQHLVAKYQESCHL